MTAPTRCRRVVKRLRSSGKRKRERPEYTQVEGPLSGKLLAASMFSENATDDVPGYNKVAQRIRSLGARLSGSVHRKVDFLVSSQDAAQQRTQRVRKALKFKVPIVSLGFLDACELGELVDHQPFLLDVPDAAPPVDAPPTAQEEAPGAGWAAPTRVVDLGCCCSCHDDGALSCAWCAEAHVDDSTAKK